MKYIARILAVVMMLSFTSCEMFNLDLVDDPNGVNPDQAGVEFLYNNIQLNFVSFVNSSFYFTASTTRMVAMTSGFTYNNAFSPTSYNGLWNLAYAELLPDMEAMLTITEERGQTTQSGSVKVMKAYLLMVLVDLFKDVPYSEALQGLDNLAPKVDMGSDLYEVAETLLDEAISDLSTEDAPPLDANNDNFYSGDATKWITLAKTLKMRKYITTRLVDAQAVSKLQEMAAAGDFISGPSEDFEFKYSSVRNNPNSRHPFYNDSYENNDGDYQSNYFMWAMLEGHGDGTPDPRIRFYFYRQEPDASNQDVNIYSCIFSDLPDQDQKPDHYSDEMPYCIVNNGYYGRDHGNGAGIPPDGPVRSVYGLYPGGGRFDDNSFDFTQNNGEDEALGVGITPIMQSSWVQFMLAEAAAVSGDAAGARGYLEAGMTQSMDKVFSFSELIDTRVVVAEDPVTGEEITLQEAYLDSIQVDAAAYRDIILASFDAATDVDGQLDVIMKQYMVALWGNGIENYNNYRRTSMPSNLQPTIEPTGGDLIRSAVYPTVFVSLNANAVQKSIDDKVFWDNNPDILK